MKKWVCKVCGYIYEGPEAPAECPVCHAKNAFNEVKGEIKLAAEHKFGVYADTVKNNPDISDEDKKFILDQLKANFNGECSEVGMYLCMARIAQRPPTQSLPRPPKIHCREARATVRAKMGGATGSGR